MSNPNGRPMLEGVIRYANGRINQAETAKIKDDEDKAPPNQRIIAERQLFNAACFQGGGHGKECHDPLGMLFLVGKLNGVVGYKMSGQEVDLPPKRILEDGRGYWNAREHFFREVGHKTASLERSSKETGTRKANRLEKEYLRCQRLLKGCPQSDLDCLHEVMDTHGGEFSQVVSRIVQTELIRKSFRLALAELATDKDEAILEAAKRALVILCGFGNEQYRLAA